MFTYHKIQEAQARIKPYVVKTPLLRLPNLDEYLGCQVYVKAECMQITGSFKLRGAMNKILSLTQEELMCGIVAASSGNHGRAVSYASKLFGTKATIVMPNTAPKIKQDAIQELGGTLYLCDASERFKIAEQLCQEQGATMVPPFNDEAVMAGQGTIGLEIQEQCPELEAVVVPVSGGGLISGIATAIKENSPEMKVIGAEPAALPRYTASLTAGAPTLVPQQQTVADALVSQKPGEVCFPYVQKYVDQVYDVDEDHIMRAAKLLLTVGKVFAEPSSCIGIGAVLQGLCSFKKTDKVCFVISGGNVALDQLDAWKEVTL